MVKIRLKCQMLISKIGLISDSKRTRFTPLSMKEFIYVPTPVYIPETKDKFISLALKTDTTPQYS